MQKRSGRAVTKQKSKSVSERGGTKRPNATDERVRRTRARIDGAFVELLFRRAYGDIRVSDIAKKAGVGRPTFYAHYATKDELLRSQFERIVGPMIVASREDTAGLDATHLFAHVATTPRFFVALMGPNSGSAPRVLRECFEARARQLLGLEGTALRSAATARFVGASLMAVLECWLERGAQQSPREVQELFAKLVGSGLKDAG